MSTIQERLAERKIKARIRLAQASGTRLGVIILQPSGVLYLHETGGYACREAQAEGVFAPLPAEADENQESLLIAYFTGPKWGGWCSDGIDVETADYVDHVFSMGFPTRQLTVDRARFADSREAWIFVDVHQSAEPELAPISGFGECKGVFVWSNSD